MHLPYAFVTQIEDIVFIFNTMLERKRELVINFHKDQMTMINTNHQTNHRSIYIFTLHKHKYDFAIMTLSFYDLSNY